MNAWQHSVARLRQEQIPAVLVGLFASPFPFVPRHLTLVGTLTIGAPAFFIALAPTADRARSGFVTRVMRFAVPVGTLAAAGTYIAYELAIHEGVKLTEARTTATLVLFAVGLFALVINARPLTTPRKWLIDDFVTAVIQPIRIEVFALQTAAFEDENKTFRRRLLWCSGDMSDKRRQRYGSGSKRDAFERTSTIE